MPQNKISSILGNTDIFFDKILKTLESLNINVSSYELDHVCYRVETIERYEELRNIFEEEGKLLSEKEINGRPICTFKLKHAVQYKEREISILELPSPKVGSPYAGGLEHVEFVIDTSFEDFLKQYPDIIFDIKAIHKEINPDIGIEYNGVRVKFHQNSLEYVVEYLE